MDGQNWAQALAVVYSEEDSIIVPDEGEPLDSDHPIVEQTGLSPQEAADGIEYLDSMGLVDLHYIEEDGSPKRSGAGEGYYDERKMNLTEKGFDVAHSRENGLRQEASSRSVAYLTGVLVITAMVQLSIASTSGSGKWDTILTSVSLLAVSMLTILAWTQMYRAGILDMNSLAERRRRFRGD